MADFFVDEARDELEWFKKDWIKIIGVGKNGINALSYFKDVDKDNSFTALAVSDKNFIANSRAEILNFISGTDWCNFGTWIILPADKISATGLTNNEIIYQVVDKITCIQSRNCVIGMDFTDVVTTLENQGRACIGFGESLDAENNSLAAVKNALKSPLFIEDIGKAKKCLLVFVGNTDSLSMLEANEADTFLNHELSQSENIWDGTLFQVVSDDTANDGVTAFVLATKFEK